MSFSFPKLALPKLQFELPEHIGRPNVEHYRAMTERLEGLAHKAGTGSASFRQRMQDFHALLRRRRRVTDIVQSPRDIRVLVAVWQAHGDIMARSPVDQATLDHLAALRPRQSLLVLFALSQLFFDRFDAVGDLAAFAAFLRTQFRLNAKRKLSHTLARLAQHARGLFSVEGPAWVVRYARKGGLPLDAAAASLGLPMEREGRFFTQCKNIYYVNTLQELQVGQDHAVLHELVQPHTYESAYEGGWLLGHKVLQIMIDKAAGRAEMPESWLRVILTIAGDPRVSTRMTHYVRWWAMLGEKYVKLVRQWLSKMDLDLFLEILWDYSQNSGKLDIQRMFPARKRFLEGVYGKGLIKGSRLFLNRQAEMYITRHYQKTDIPSFSRVQGGSCSIIYLNIGGIHVIEGTHNFALRISPELLPKNPVENYENDTVYFHSLTACFERPYQLKFGNTNSMKIPHHGAWQHKVIAALKALGTNINPEDVLSAEDYRMYRRSYGIWS